jgi:hypothetical protein
LTEGQQGQLYKKLDNFPALHRSVCPKCGILVDSANLPTFGQEEWIGKIKQSLDIAKADINQAVTAHLDNLIEEWRKYLATHNDDFDRAIAKCYIDAYLSIKHNIQEHDAFNLKKWFGSAEL